MHFNFRVFSHIFPNVKLKDAKLNSFKIYSRFSLENQSETVEKQPQLSQNGRLYHMHSMGIFRHMRKYYAYKGFRDFGSILITPSKLANQNLNLKFKGNIET